MKNKWIAAFCMGMVGAGALLAGCSSTPTNLAPVIEERPTPTGSGGGSTTSGGGTSDGRGSAGSTGSSALQDPNNILSHRNVYFDYDSFAIKDEFRPAVQAHAGYLQAHRNARMTIQGNTDERGSREYNIALGQKRSDAVKRMMQVMGINEAQVETVSFGKEKPKAEGHDEAAWSQDRRADIVYSGDR